jgi:3-isopropylmalate dehydrogenase
MKLLVLPGDHVGPEIVAEALKVLGVIVEFRADVKINIQYGLIGGASIDKHGVPITEEVFRDAETSDAVLLGSVGGPEWFHVPGHLSPEQGILQLRQRLMAFANIRPCQFPAPGLTGQSPLKKDVVSGTNFILVRENCGGAYFGAKEEQQDMGSDLWVYTRPDIERCARVSAALASHFGRAGDWTASGGPAVVWNVDKANVLASSRVWRKVTHETFEKEFPGLELRDQLADSMAMFMVRSPTQFNGIIHTDNTFGDILSDISGGLIGSLGLLPSASVCAVPGDGPCRGIYEAVHGSAPDISGQGVVNPVAQILSLALLLRYSFNMPDEARMIEMAVKETLESEADSGLGLRTTDIGGSATTVEVGDAICLVLRKKWASYTSLAGHSE